MKYIVSAILILFFSYFEVFDPLKDLYIRVISPVQFGLEEGAAGIKDYFAFYTGLKSIRIENLSLKEKLLSLESELFELEVLRQENDYLRSQLQNKNDLKLQQELLLASVMGNSVDLSGSTVYIDKGYLHGVSKGDNVIVDNLIVGIIKDVSSSKSLVELITSSKSSATVYDIDSVNKTEGLAVGQLGTAVVMERVLTSEDILVGDMIATSGKDGIFIPELYVGRVKEVESDPSQPLKRAYVSTLTDLSKLRKVFVILERDSR